jgi:hypothetical protein
VSKAEQDRVVEWARAEADELARADERRKAAVRLVDAEMRTVAVARGVPADQLNERLDLLDRTKFLNDTGDVDRDKVINYVAAMQPASGRQANGHRTATRSVAAGAARYTERHARTS